MHTGRQWERETWVTLLLMYAVKITFSHQVHREIPSDCTLYIPKLHVVHIYMAYYHQCKKKKKTFKSCAYFWQLWHAWEFFSYIISWVNIIQSLERKNNVKEEFKCKISSALLNSSKNAINVPRWPYFLATLLQHISLEAKRAGGKHAKPKPLTISAMAEETGPLYICPQETE